MSVRLWRRALAPALATLLLAACSTPEVPSAPDAGPTANAGAADAGPAPAPRASAADAGQDQADPAIGWCGEVVVHMSDYAEALKRFAVFAPDPDTRALPAELLKTPHFQQRTALGLLDVRLSRRLAAEHGVSPDAEALAAAMAREPRLARFNEGTPQQRQQLLDDFGLTREDLEEVALDRLLYELLPEAMVSAPEGEALWELYRLDRERVELEFVAIPNTPSARAIDELVERDGARIASWYEAHKDDFRVPASRRVRIIHLDVPKGDQDAARAARQKLHELRLQALSGQDFAALARAHSQAPSASDGGDLGFVVRRQRPEAFSVAPGEVTEPAQGQGGWFILKVEEELPGHLKPLTSPVRREIAARLLRDDGPQPPAMEAAARIAAAWGAVPGGPAGTSPTLEATLAQLHLRREHTFPFNTEGPPDRFIPGIGVAPTLMAAAARLTPEAPISSPILHRGQVYILALKKKGRATRSEFSVEGERFAAQWLEQQRRSVLDRRLTELKRGCEAHFNLNPVRARYGVLREKPGQTPPPGRGDGPGQAPPPTE